LDSRKQLESAVGSIAERFSRADAGALETEAKKLASQRLDLLKKLDEIRNQLSEARADEYRDVVLGGKSWGPADAARKAAQEKDTCSWIPGPVAASPLCRFHQVNWPTFTARTLPSPARTKMSSPAIYRSSTIFLALKEFDAAVNEQSRLGMEDLDFRSDLWQSQPPQGSADDLQTLIVNLAHAVEPLSGKDKWKLAAVYAGKYGDTYRQPWDQLVGFVRRVHREAANTQESFVKFGPQISRDSSLEDQERAAGEILSHLENGGKLVLSRFSRTSLGANSIEQTRVNNARLVFRALSCAASTLPAQEPPPGSCHALGSPSCPLGTPHSNEMGEEVEKTLIQFCDSIRRLSRMARAHMAPSPAAT